MIQLVNVSPAGIVTAVGDRAVGLALGPNERQFIGLPLTNIQPGWLWCDGAAAPPPAGPPVPQAVVHNGDQIVVHDAAGAPVAGSPGAAEVSGGVLNDVKLTV
jgi:hypothetical protein